MEYSKSYLEEVVEEYGEVFVVLESGEEYEIHGTRSFEFDYQNASKIVQVEGMRDGEYVIVDIPLDTIEHHYTHAEV